MYKTNKGRFAGVEKHSPFVINQEHWSILVQYERTLAGLKDMVEAVQGWVGEVRREVG